MQDETMSKTKHKTIALGFKNSSCLLTLLISVFLFYKTHSPNKSLLAKNNVKKHAFYPFFQSFVFYFYINFEHSNCVLHHFAFLFARLFTNFHRAKNHF